MHLPVLEILASEVEGIGLILGVKFWIFSFLLSSHPVVFRSCLATLPVAHSHVLILVGTSRSHRAWEGLALAMRRRESGIRRASEVPGEKRRKKGSMREKGRYSKNFLALGVKGRPTLLTPWIKIYL